MSSVQTNTTSLQERKVNALTLLSTGEKTSKTDSIRLQIESIDPENATRREIDRLKALCLQVERYHESDQPKKRFEHMQDFDRRQSAARNPQNYRGRGRTG